MQKILFTTDFSPMANHAFKYALAFASHYKMSVTVLNVYHYNEAEARLAPVEVLEDLHSTRREEAFEKFQEYRDQAAEIGFEDLRIEPLIKSGFAADMILEACEQLETDLIVMGCKGDSGWTDRIFGSVALHIMREATCPVLAIPLRASFEPLTILFYAEESEQDGDKRSAKLQSLARRLQAELSHVHVDAHGNKHIAHKIAEICIQLDADAVVLAPKHHSFFENLIHPSITEELTEALEIPIFSLH